MAWYDTTHTNKPVPPYRKGQESTANSWLVSDLADNALQPVARQAVYPRNYAEFTQTLHTTEPVWDKDSGRMKQRYRPRKPTQEELRTFGVREVTPNNQIPYWRLPRTVDEVDVVNAQILRQQPARQNFAQQQTALVDKLAAAAAAAPTKELTIDSLPPAELPAGLHYKTMPPPNSNATYSMPGIGAAPVIKYTPVTMQDYKPYMDEYSQLVGDLTPEMQQRLSENERRLAEEEQGNFDTQLMRFGLGMLGKPDFYQAVGESGTNALNAYVGNKKQFRQERDQLAQDKETIARQRQMQVMQALGLAQGQAQAQTGINQANETNRVSVDTTNAQLAMDREQIKATLRTAMEQAKAASAEELNKEINALWMHVMKLPNMTVGTATQLVNDIIQTRYPELGRAFDAPPGADMRAIPTQNPMTILNTAVE